MLRRFLPPVVAVLLLAALLAGARAQTVTTDRADYAPGEVVQIAAAGFHPNETVWPQVTASDGGPQRARRP